MKAREFRSGGCAILMLPVIKGLVSESESVKEAFVAAKPDKIAISISNVGF